jgi:hypothetical protein
VYVNLEKRADAKQGQASVASPPPQLRAICLRHPVLQIVEFTARAQGESKVQAIITKVTNAPILAAIALHCTAQAFSFPNCTQARRPGLPPRPAQLKH